MKKSIFFGALALVLVGNCPAANALDAKALVACVKKTPDLQKANKTTSKYFSAEVINRLSKKTTAQIKAAKTCEDLIKAVEPDLQKAAKIGEAIDKWIGPEPTAADIDTDDDDVTTLDK